MTGKYMPQRQAAARRILPHKRGRRHPVITGFVGLIAGVGLGSYFTLHPFPQPDWTIITGAITSVFTLGEPSQEPLPAVQYPEAPWTPYQMLADREPTFVEKQARKSVILKNTQ